MIRALRETRLAAVTISPAVFRTGLLLRQAVSRACVESSEISSSQSFHMHRRTRRALIPKRPAVVLPEDFRYAPQLVRQETACWQRSSNPFGVGSSYSGRGKSSQGRQQPCRRALRICTWRIVCLLSSALRSHRVAEHRAPARKGQVANVAASRPSSARVPSSRSSGVSPPSRYTACSV